MDRLQTRQGLQHNWLVQFGVCLLAALLMRFPTFGDVNLHIDENFYLLVGHMMHQGAVPYVDVWDRKPFGLFLIYFIFASFGGSPLAYQLGAWLSVGTTAFIVNRIAGRMTGRSGALLAGVLYAAACTALGGIGGQAEVFCNLLIAAAFYLLIRNLDSLKSGELSREIHCVMFLLGTAITIKQTSIFPSLFLGLLVSALLLRSGWSKLATSRAAAQFVMAGVLPSALIAGAYWIAGYWAEFFHAMVTSNLTKGREAEAETLARAMLMLARLAPLITLALLSVLLQRFRAKRLQMQVLRLLGWLVSVVIGLFVVPNFFLHYALPLAVPLAILAAPVLDRKGVGLIIALPSISILALSNFPFDLGRVHRSNASIAILASAMRDHAPRGTALVFDGPVYLYALSGLRPLSPLVFPNHLSQETERNVSPYETNREVRRILENGPGAVVISANPSTANPNVEAWRLVTSYVARHCKPIESRTVSSWGVSDSEIRVFGDCEPAIKLQMN